MANTDADITLVFFFTINIIAIPSAHLDFVFKKGKHERYHGPEKAKLWAKQSALSLYFVFSSFFSVPAFLFSLSKDVHMNPVFMFLWAAFCVWGARRYC